MRSSEMQVATLEGFPEEGAFEATPKRMGMPLQRRDRPRPRPPPLELPEQEHFRSSRTTRLARTAHSCGSVWSPIGVLGHPRSPETRSCAKAPGTAQGREQGQPGPGGEAARCPPGGSWPPPGYGEAAVEGRGGARREPGPAVPRPSLSPLAGLQGSAPRPASPAGG